MSHHVPLKDFHVGSALGRDTVQYPHAGSKHKLRHGTESSHKAVSYVNGFKIRAYGAVYDDGAKRWQDFLLYFNTARIRVAWYRAGYWVLGINRPFPTLAALLQSLVARGDAATLCNKSQSRETWRLSIVEHAARRVYKKPVNAEHKRQLTNTRNNNAERAGNTRADIRTKNDFFAVRGDTYVDRNAEQVETMSHGDAQDTARKEVRAIERDTKKWSKPESLPWHARTREVATLGDNYAIAPPYAAPDSEKLLPSFPD